MAFKDTWRPRVDGLDIADASAVNEIAEETIRLGDNIGEIDTALDTILAIQNELIGG